MESNLLPISQPVCEWCEVSVSMSISRHAPKNITGLLCKACAGHGAQWTVAEEPAKNPMRSDITLAETYTTSQWQTDPVLFKSLNRVFSFEVDLCASATNHLICTFITAKEDALTCNWLEYGESGFMSPPKKNVPPFLDAAYRWREKGFTTAALVPTETKKPWMAEYIAEKKADYALFLTKPPVFISPSGLKGTGMISNWGILIFSKEHPRLIQRKLSLFRWDFWHLPRF